MSVSLLTDLRRAMEELDASNKRRAHHAQRKKRDAIQQASGTALGREANRLGRVTYAPEETRSPGRRWNNEAVMAETSDTVRITVDLTKDEALIMLRVLSIRYCDGADNHRPAEAVAFTEASAKVRAAILRTGIDAEAEGHDSTAGSRRP
jgi:hypothetical protein